VLLVGGGLGNAVLFAIGAAFRARGSRVLYFAGYKLVQDRYKVEEIEHAADCVAWCCDEAPGFCARRAAGPRLSRIEAYGRGALGPWRSLSRRSTASSRWPLSPEPARRD
jgi:hypothetical protein